ncbi:hypothetical protein N8071_00090 [bacterium]|nr:hypothetical protein [bacterium]
MLFKFSARSQGSYDIGYGGDTTGDDWPRRMLNGVKLYPGYPGLDRNFPLMELA